MTLVQARWLQVGCGCCRCWHKEDSMRWHHVTCKICRAAAEADAESTSTWCCRAYQLFSTQCELQTSPFNEHATLFHPRFTNKLFKCLSSVNHIMDYVFLLQRFYTVSWATRWSVSCRNPLSWQILFLWDSAKPRVRCKVNSDKLGQLHKTTENLYYY